MVEPISTSIITFNFFKQIVNSEPFQDFGTSLAKGAGGELGKNLVKSGSIIYASNSSNFTSNSRYQEIIKDYLEKDISQREKALEAQKEFGQNLLKILGEYQKQTNANKLREIQNDWDKDNWFSKLDRHETEQILGRTRHGLLILASPPNISPDCPDSFQNNLEQEIRNELGRFLSSYYPLASSISPVEFYGDYFKVPISSIDVKRLQSLLQGLPTVVLYSDITDYQVNFHLDCLGLEVQQYSFPTWDWEASYEALEQSMGAKKALRTIRKTIVDVHILLSAFISELYYLKINPIYEPQWQKATASLPSTWVKSYSEPLNQIYRLNQAAIAYEKGLLLLKNERYAEASKCFDYVLEVQPESAQTWFNYGLALQKINRIEEANKSFGQAFKLQPELGFKFPIKSAIDYTEDLPNRTKLEMVYIPEGTFMMGSSGSEGMSDEKPQHRVTVPSFLMGKYPITQAQWRAIAKRTDLKAERDLDSNPALFKGDRRPIERVSWYDAVEFCARLSKLTAKEYRLPSEAEWEYACRAGTTTPFYFGETISTDLANYDGNYTYGSGTKGEYREQTTPVGNFPPNAFGLYDMHGNVYEWCADAWHDNYEGAPTDGSAWLKNGNDNRSPLRGGSWVVYPVYCRSGFRSHDFRAGRDFIDGVVGFRVVCGVGGTT